MLEGTSLGGRVEACDGWRGVSTVLGAILVFAIAVALVAVIQATAIPAMNEEIEQEHHQQLTADMTNLDMAVSQAVSRATGERVAVRLGTEYPPRPAFLNPGPVSGHIQTEDLGDIVVEHAVTDGEAGDYWNGSAHQFDTKLLEYRPNYAFYQNAPTTVYEHAILYDQYGTQTQLSNGAPPLVSGRRITLISLTGNFSATTASERSLRIVPVSAPPSRTAVTNASDGPLTIRLPTRLSNETWSSLLREQFVSNGGHILAQQYEPADADEAVSTLILTFEPGETYRLQMARVSISETDDSSQSPRYLTDIDGTIATTQPNDSEEVSVVVRDRYNNPVPNATVRLSSPPENGSVAVEGIPGATSVRTDENGHARFTYTPPSTYTAPTERFTLSVDRVAGEAGRVRFTMRQQRPFELSIENGTVVSTASSARVTLLGTALTAGGGRDDPKVPISIEIKVGEDSPFEPWPDDVNDEYMADGGERYYSVTNQENGTSISVTATSELSRLGLSDIEVSSDESRNENPELVDVFLAGDRKPDYEGFGGQADAEAYLAEYIGPNNRITIDQNQAIFLFELGTRDPGGAAADYQDAVVLVTFFDEEDDDNGRGAGG